MCANPWPVYCRRDPGRSTSVTREPADSRTNRIRQALDRAQGASSLRRSFRPGTPTRVSIGHGSPTTRSLPGPGPIVLWSDVRACLSYGGNQPGGHARLTSGTSGHQPRHLAPSPPPYWAPCPSGLPGRRHRPTPRTACAPSSSTPVSSSSSVVVGSPFAILAQHSRAGARPGRSGAAPVHPVWTGRTRLRPRPCTAPSNRRSRTQRRPICGPDTRTASLDTST